MNHYNKLVSIITPTYNCAAFIAETIESVKTQSYVNWEMIIVDDCSTDNTHEIVQKYAQNDHRIRYFCLQHNSGAAVARNEAIKLAQGRWIAFLDSDDLWDVCKLEKQLNFMISNSYKFSYTEYREVNYIGQIITNRITGPTKITKLGMLLYCWPGCLTVMYDSSAIGLIQIPPIKKNNDYAMWLLISQRADCHLLKETLASYRRREGSISNQGYFTLIKWHYRLFKSVLNANSFKCCMFTLNNIFFGIIKRLAYRS